KWYWFDTHGYMATGWLKRGDTWYYLTETGAMAQGWQKVKGEWYLLADTGEMLTGWQTIDGKRCYLAESGQLTYGWLKKGSTWYYADGAADGSCVTDCIKEIDGKAYAFNTQGGMLEGAFEVTADAKGALSIKADD
ncbi:cell wall-binding repeat protein, partial [Atopobium deltae]